MLKGGEGGTEEEFCQCTWCNEADLLALKMGHTCMLENFIMTFNVTLC